jgi:mRNA-degrading endonuclease toxin of MazEF toxin-antitoxin module
MNVRNYKQGDIIIVKYPLSDKPEKSIVRPVLIISNQISNAEDNDVLVCQITTRLRNNHFLYPISDNHVTVPMPQASEVRCNKIATIRIWDKIVLDKLSAVTPAALQAILKIVGSAF